MTTTATPELDRFRAPVPGASLVAFRVALGLGVAVAAARFVWRGWVDQLLVDPSYHFTYPGLSWVRPLPAVGMYLVMATTIVAALAFAAGIRPRWTATVFTVLFAYVEAIDATTYLNHYELVTLLGVLSVVLPIPGRGPARRESVPVGAVWLLRFQLGLVYVFAGLGKIDLDWLGRGEPLRTWLSGRTDLAVVGEWLARREVAVALSWAGAVFDLTVVGFLLWRRSRPVAYLAVVAFHAATAWLFPAIGVFPYLMVALTPIFFDPDWPLRVRSKVVGTRPAVPTRAPAPAPGTSRAAVGFAVVWIVVQLAVPLRHLAYPGDVRWTEEGYRWSWRVLLTEKEGTARFRVTDPATGRERVVFPSDELAPFQVRAMSTRPDLLRQYAHHLADMATARGEPRPEVRVDAWVAIAGRPRVRLIDPAVDLAAEPLGLGPARHIEPSPL